MPKILNEQYKWTFGNYTPAFENKECYIYINVPTRTKCPFDASHFRWSELVAEYSLFCEVVEDFIDVLGDEGAVVIVDGEHLVDELVACDVVFDVGDDVVGYFVELEHAVEFFGIVANCYSYMVLTYWVEIEFVFEFHIVMYFSFGVSHFACFL